MNFNFLTLLSLLRLYSASFVEGEAVKIVRLASDLLIDEVKFRDNMTPVVATPTNLPRLIMALKACGIKRAQVAGWGVHRMVHVLYDNGCLVPAIRTDLPNVALCERRCGRNEYRVICIFNPHDSKAMRCYEVSCKSTESWTCPAKFPPCPPPSGGAWAPGPCEPAIPTPCPSLEPPVPCPPVCAPPCPPEPCPPPAPCPDSQACVPCQTLSGGCHCGLTLSRRTAEETACGWAEVEKLKSSEIRYGCCVENGRRETRVLLDTRQATTKKEHIVIPCNDVSTAIYPDILMCPDELYRIQACLSEWYNGSVTLYVSSQNVLFACIWNSLRLLTFQEGGIRVQKVDPRACPHLIENGLTKVSFDSSWVASK